MMSPMEAPGSRIDEAVKGLLADPPSGEPKTGTLKGVRVIKFKVGRQQLLLAYQFDAKRNMIAVLDVGPQENFYRELRNTSMRGESEGGGAGPNTQPVDGVTEDVRAQLGSVPGVGRAKHSRSSPTSSRARRVLQNRQVEGGVARHGATVTRVADARQLFPSSSSTMARMSSAHATT
jgi:hypothetical protein